MAVIPGRTNPYAAQANPAALGVVVTLGDMYEGEIADGTGLSNVLGGFPPLRHVWKASHETVGWAALELSSEPGAGGPVLPSLMAGCALVEQPLQFFRPLQTHTALGFNPPALGT